MVNQQFSRDHIKIQGFLRDFFQGFVATLLMVKVKNPLLVWKCTVFPVPISPQYIPISVATLCLVMHMWQHTTLTDTMQKHDVLQVITVLGN